MLVSAFFMFRNGNSKSGRDEEAESKGDSIPLKTLMFLAVVGAGVGILTGLVGVSSGLKESGFCYLPVPPPPLLSYRLPSLRQIVVLTAVPFLILCLKQLSCYTRWLGGRV
jgi:uncharacterized membrane protein YfcA